VKGLAEYLHALFMLDRWIIGCPLCYLCFVLNGVEGIRPDIQGQPADRCGEPIQPWRFDFKMGKAALVEEPVKQALEANGGEGPERFLLSDNGTPYVSDEHGKLLEKADIVHKLTPALCSPIQWGC